MDAAFQEVMEGARSLTNAPYSAIITLDAEGPGGRPPGPGLHGSPDSSWNRFSRSGEQSGNRQVILLLWVRCPGVLHSSGNVETPLWKPDAGAQPQPDTRVDGPMARPESLPP